MADNKSNKPVNQDNKSGMQIFLKALPYIIVLVILGVIIYFVFFYSPYQGISVQELEAIFGVAGNKIQSWKASSDGAVVTIYLTYIDAHGVKHMVSAVVGYGTADWSWFFGASGKLVGPTAPPGGFQSAGNNSVWLSLIFNLLPILIIVGISIFLFRSMSKGRGMDFGLGKNKAQIVNSNLTFNDVAGYKEEKKELEEIVSFLKEPSRFKSMGIRLPKGIMLVGPSGTGKTMLAKATAGEANVPFMLISGSDFVEMFVGLGASRVRDMFKAARKVAPCIIFIDEIDTVGRHRGVGMGGGNDEREQTLNQLLVELDGFEENKGVIVMAATNRLDVIDNALLRPGRFDRQVLVSLPNLEERIQIFKVHLRNKNYDQKVSLEDLARRTAGFSGAQIENMINESAILSVRLNKTQITQHEFDEGFDRAIAGLAKVTKVYTPKEKELIAYHESGHALLGVLSKGAEKVQKVTIIPRGQAGGYTLSTPLEDTSLSSKEDLLTRIKVTLGGRAAEHLVYGINKITTGASNDLTVVSNITRKMVAELGMSDLGLINYNSFTNSPYQDYLPSGNSSLISDMKANEIDNEIEKIVNYQYKQAYSTLEKNRVYLDLMAKALIKYETILDSDIDYILEHKKIKEKTIDELIHKNLVEPENKDRKVKTSFKQVKEETPENIDNSLESTSDSQTGIETKKKKVKISDIDNK